MTDHTPSWYPSSSTPAEVDPPSGDLPSIITEPIYTAPRSSRRKFLGLAAAGAATVGGGAVLLGGDRSIPGAEAVSDAVEALVPTPTTRPLIASEDVAGRTLVVIELQGGNDGLATLVPRNAGTLYDRREAVHIPDEELLDFTDEFGWNPALEGISRHGMAVLLGLGSTSDPDGSHFEMERRWWAGKSSGSELPGTGFLGRLCDQLVTDQPVTGVALGRGPSPSMRCDKAVTVGLNDPQSAWFLSHEDPWFENLRRGMAGMAQPDGTEVGPIPHARTGLTDTLAFGETLQEINNDAIKERYPDTDLGWSLGTAAQLIEQDAGVRVLHVTHGGFDTHSNQRGEHDNLLQELGDSLGPFLDDLADRGHAESTLVATTSEFGRRVPANEGGTDHGAAGMAMLAGPVNAGIHGEMPSLTQLDDDNLIASIDFEEYYSTIAERWFGIPSSEVLESGVAPIDGLL